MATDVCKQTTIKIRKGTHNTHTGLHVYTPLSITTVETVDEAAMRGGG